MFFVLMAMLVIDAFKSNSYSYSKPETNNTLLKIGIALVLVPGITIGGTLFAVGTGIYFAGMAVKTVATIAITGAVNIVTSPFYLIRRIFSKKE